MRVHNDIYRALMVILQSHGTQNMISKMLSQCICCASETYQILSPVLFQQSLYFPLLIHRIFHLFVSSLVLHAFAKLSLFTHVYTTQASGAFLRLVPRPEKVGIAATMKQCVEDSVARR